MELAYPLLAEPELGIAQSGSSLILFNILGNFTVVSADDLFDETLTILNNISTFIFTNKQMFILVTFCI